MLKSSYSLEAGIKILRNQILCIFLNFQNQLKKVWDFNFWGRFSLYNDCKFWTKNVCFEGVPIVRFGSYFRRMHKIWFRKIFIPASRLYDLFENPRSLEAARGRGHFWHPETRGSHLSTIYGGQNDLSIDWPLAASSDLGFSKRSYSLEAFVEVASTFNFSSSHKIWAQSAYSQNLKNRCNREVKTRPN